jgi:hypothetical protein
MSEDLGSLGTVEIGFVNGLTTGVPLGTPLETLAPYNRVSSNINWNLASVGVKTAARKRLIPWFEGLAEGRTKRPEELLNELKFHETLIIESTIIDSEGESVGGTRYKVLKVWDGFIYYSQLNGGGFGNGVFVSKRDGGNND